MGRLLAFWNLGYSEKEHSFASEECKGLRVRIVRANCGFLANMERVGATSIRHWRIIPCCISWRWRKFLAGSRVRLYSFGGMSRWTGDREKASLRFQFNPQIRLALHGATITSDAGLLAFRELDDALDLTPILLPTISRKAVPAATSATTWSLCSASPSTAAWPATMR